MTREEYKLLCGLIYKHSGIVLAADKGYLLESRLNPLARAHGLGDVSGLAARVQSGSADNRLLHDIIEAMTTNETLFFRDIRPFDQLRQLILPRLAKARAASRRIRLWSAACSTGQEPYSFAMIIKDIGELLNGWRVEIFATDLSREALDKAKAGLYSQFEVQRGLPVTMMTKYFKRTDETWQIDSAIRAMVTFRELNLLEDFSRLGSFDAVYCRNVLIYFDHETKADILERIRKLLPSDGYLSLGGAETVLGVTEAFKPIAEQRGLYAPAGTSAATSASALRGGSFSA